MSKPCTLLQNCELAYRPNLRHSLFHHCLQILFSSMLVLSSYRKSLISLYLAYSLSLALALSYPGEKQSLLLHALS